MTHELSWALLKLFDVVSSTCTVLETSPLAITTIASAVLHRRLVGVREALITLRGIDSRSCIQ